MANVGLEGHPSFCGKAQHEVSKIIAGPGVYICNECIDLSSEILSEEAEPSTELFSTELLLIRLKGTAKTLTRVEADMCRNVAAARRREVGWDTIGRGLGLSPQDADQGLRCRMRLAHKIIVPPRKIWPHVMARYPVRTRVRRTVSLCTVFQRKSSVRYPRIDGSYAPVSASKIDVASSGTET